MQPFTTRRAFPLGPMPELRLERAPILTPEYRGKTPRAALHRMQREQLALPARESRSMPASMAIDSVHTPVSNPPRLAPIAG